MKLMPAIIGDICGSIYERGIGRIKREPNILMLEAYHFTDDTVHTIAVAEAILENPENPDFETKIIKYTGMYPGAGYGERFIKWCFEGGPNDSFGNGCCMRLSPIVEYYKRNYSKEWYLVPAMVSKSVSCSHNHLESYVYSFILADYIKNHGRSNEIHEWMNDLQSDWYWDAISIEEYRQNYKFDATCKGFVPEAIIVSQIANSYTDAIKKAISLGGDTDTIASMAGAIWGEEDSGEYRKLEQWAWSKLPKRFQDIITKFDELCKQ